MKIFIYCGIFLLYVSVFTVNAQKFPGIQKAGLYAPVNIKIDGNITEWGDNFKAYNNATSIFYTMANDNNNLYLAVQATDPLIIRKIINGGITLTIDTGNKKNHGKGITITYPVFTKTNRPFINLNDKPAPSKYPALDKKQLDSFVYVINQRFADRSKEIKIQGIPSITDSLISIYNEKGIKAAVLFSDKAIYNYELAVPIKYLDISAERSAKLNYIITLNGSPQRDGVTITQVSQNTVKMSVLIGKGAPSPLTSSESAIITSPTYLKGEYTFVVK